MDKLNTMIDQINAFAWGPPMLGMLGVTGVLLTLGLLFMPWRKVGYGFRLLFDKGSAVGEGEVKPFNALMTALSATVGTGNIAGVATAIALGGPGAIFYMWVIALFGMATKYAEAVCAVTYREKDATGKYVGGPMYYLRNGVGEFAPELGKWLGLAFAVFGAVAAFGIGNAVQVNSMAVALVSSFGVPTWLTGVVVAVLVGFVILGGIRRIGDVAGKLVPAMIVLYLGAALLIIIINIAEVPAAISLIFTHAFTPAAATGGFAGAAVAAAIRLRCRTRGVLQRVGPGLGRHRPRGGDDEQPGAAGDHRHAGHVHRHPRGVHDDGVGDPHLGGVDDDRCGRQRADRRGAHLDRIPEFDCRRPVHRHHRVGGVRLHHHSRVVVLRRTVLAILVQREEPVGVPRVVGAGRALLRQREGGLRLEPVGHPQRADGGAQPHRFAAAGADGVQGDPRLLRGDGDTAGETAVGVTDGHGRELRPARRTSPRRTAVACLSISPVSGDRQARNRSRVCCSFD